MIPEKQMSKPKRKEKTEFITKLRKSMKKASITFHGGCA